MVTAITGDVVHLTRIVQITRLCQVAPSALMAYDYLICIDQEIEQIWKRPRTTTTILYLAIRYIGTIFGLFNTAVFLFDVSSKLCALCHTFLIVQGWPSCLIIWLVQIILQMRLYALYDHSRKVMLVMGIAFMVEVLAMATILMLSNVSSGTSNEPLPGVKFCTNENMPNSFYIFWLPVLCYEWLLCSLAIWAGIQRSRDELRLMAISNKVRLLDVLIKGNVMYFLVISFVCVVNAVMWATLPEEWIEVPEGFPHATAVISGCRLILHIRNAASPPFSDEDTFHESRLAFVYPMR